MKRSAERYSIEEADWGESLRKELAAEMECTGIPEGFSSEFLFPKFPSLLERDGGLGAMLQKQVRSFCGSCARCRWKRIAASDV